MKNVIRALIAGYIGFALIACNSGGGGGGGGLNCSGRNANSAACLNQGLGTGGFGHDGYAGVGRVNSYEMSVPRSGSVILTVHPRIGDNWLGYSGILAGAAQVRFNWRLNGGAGMRNIRYSEYDGYSDDSNAEWTLATVDGQGRSFRGRATSIPGGFRIESRDRRTGRQTIIIGQFLGAGLQIKIGAMGPRGTVLVASGVATPNGGGNFAAISNPVVPGRRRY